MFNVVFALVVFLVVFSILLAGAYFGKRFGQWQLKHHELVKLEVITVIEGAVFALLGLLIAFTFSGAYERFEARKTHIIEEANLVDTAYLRIDLLAPSVQSDLRESFRQYIDVRLQAYKDIPNLKVADEAIKKSAELQAKIWSQALAACKITHDEAATELLVPAINNMFEIEDAGFALTRVHPPVVIFILLIALAALSTFLAGYSRAEKKERAGHSVYITLYIAITAFIIYMIIDIELPRVGLIRVTAFDQQLIDVRDKMK